jgi:uncharacterized protein YjbI with pentapeptide repeats
MSTDFSGSSLTEADISADVRCNLSGGNLTARTCASDLSGANLNRASSEANERRQDGRR